MLGLLLTISVSSIRLSFVMACKLSNKGLSEGDRECREQSHERMVHFISDLRAVGKVQVEECVRIEQLHHSAGGDPLHRRKVELGEWTCPDRHAGTSVGGPRQRHLITQLLNVPFAIVREEEREGHVVDLL